jgi:hypothetical protein
MEIWKRIPNFSRYEASTYGNLRSTNYKNSGSIKILKPSISGGYYKTMLQSDEKKYKSWNVHKFVCLAFLEKVEGKKHINHKDGNKLNNLIENLEWCTNQENIQHAYDNGLIKPKVGSLNGMAKLNESQVREIRLHAKNNGRNYGRKMLAEKYKVSECTIKEVVTRRKNKFYNVTD